MKLIYLANVGLPSAWAHGIQIMKMCEAFATLGIEVELIVPSRSDKVLVNEDPFVFYNVARTFKIKRIFCIDLVPGGTSSFSFLLRTFSFLCAARIYLFFRRFEILCTREQFAGIFFRKVVYELHYNIIKKFGKTREDVLELLDELGFKYRFLSKNPYGCEYYWACK